MIDISQENQTVQDLYDQVKNLVLDIQKNEDRYIIVAQTPLRVNLGLPPMEIVNTLEAGLQDLKTISKM